MTDFFNSIIARANQSQGDRLRSQSAKEKRDKLLNPFATYQGIDPVDGSDRVMINGETNSGFKLISNAPLSIGERVYLRENKSGGLQRVDARNRPPIQTIAEIIKKVFIKILFLKDGKLYIGGDRDEPEEVYTIPSGWDLYDSNSGAAMGYLNNLGSNQKDWLLNLAIRENSTNNFELKTINTGGVIASQSFTFDNPYSSSSFFFVKAQNGVFSNSIFHYSFSYDEDSESPTFGEINNFQAQFSTLFWDSINNIFSIGYLDLSVYSPDSYSSGNLPINALNSNSLDCLCVIETPSNLPYFFMGSALRTVERNLLSALGRRADYGGDGSENTVYTDYFKTSGITTYPNAEFLYDGSSSVTGSNCYTPNHIGDILYSGEKATLTDSLITIHTTTLGVSSAAITSENVEHLGFGSLSLDDVIDVSFAPTY